MAQSDEWNERAQVLADDIRSMIARLDDLSFDVLRQAARLKSGRPSADKKLMQVRRSLEKAAHLLGQPGFDATGDSETDEF